MSQQQQNTKHRQKLQKFLKSVDDEAILQALGKYSAEINNKQDVNATENTVNEFIKHFEKLMVLLEGVEKLNTKKQKEKFILGSIKLKIKKIVDDHCTKADRQDGVYKKLLIKTLETSLTDLSKCYRRKVKEESKVTKFKKGVVGGFKKRFLEKNPNIPEDKQETEIQMTDLTDFPKKDKIFQEKNKPDKKGKKRGKKSTFPNISGAFGAMTSPFSRKGKTKTRSKQIQPGKQFQMTSTTPKEIIESESDSEAESGIDTPGTKKQSLTKKLRRRAGGFASNVGKIGKNVGNFMRRSPQECEEDNLRILNTVLQIQNSNSDNKQAQYQVLYEKYEPKIVQKAIQDRIKTLKLEDKRVLAGMYTNILGNIKKNQTFQIIDDAYL